MEKKFDLKSYIAIDDISFSEQCDRTIDCDFDDGVCSYTSDYNSYNYVADYQFGRFIGPPLARDWVGPGYDHTKQTYGGGYLYMTGYPSTFKTKRTAMIQTPVMTMIYEKSSNSCLSMFTYISAADAELIVSVRLFAQDGSTTSHPLISLNKIAESKWTRHYADIDGSVFKGQKEFIITIEGSTTEINTIIAIDDISYSAFDCAFKQEFKCKNGKSVPMDVVCNCKFSTTHFQLLTNLSVTSFQLSTIAEMETTKANVEHATSKELTLAGMLFGLFISHLSNLVFLSSFLSQLEQRF